MRKLNYILRGLKVCHDSYYDRGWAIRDWKAYLKTPSFIKYSKPYPMKRIEPELFLEVWRDVFDGQSEISDQPEPIFLLKEVLKYTVLCGHTTTAIFLIQPSNLSL